VSGTDGEGVSLSDVLGLWRWEIVVHGNLHLNPPVPIPYRKKIDTPVVIPYVLTCT
jgi:hypothetical protein